MGRIKMKLFLTDVYTITGKKIRYSLGDMAYGEWLVFKNNYPVYFLNLLDFKGDVKKHIDQKNIQKSLERKLKKFDSEFTLKQHFIGIRSHKTSWQWVEVESLPFDKLI